MIGQGFEEVVAEVPAQGQAVGDDPHQLALGADVLEEHDELELEEDDRVNRRPAASRVEWGDQLPHEREVEPSLKAAVEVLLWNQILQREVVGKRGEGTDLGAHHDLEWPPAWDGRPC